MDSATWDSLRKSSKVKSILQSVHLSSALVQLKWSSLTGGDRKKIEAVTKGRGWHEDRKPVVTRKGVKKVAPKHRQAAITDSLKDTLREPMVESVKPVKKEKEIELESEPVTTELEYVYKPEKSEFQKFDEIQAQTYVINVSDLSRGDKILRMHDSSYYDVKDITADDVVIVDATLTITEPKYIPIKNNTIGGYKLVTDWKSGKELLLEFISKIESAKSIDQLTKIGRDITEAQDHQRFITVDRDEVQNVWDIYNSKLKLFRLDPAVYEDIVTKIRDASTLKEVGEINQLATLAEIKEQITPDQLDRIYSLVHEKDDYLSRNRDDMAVSFKQRIDTAANEEEMGIILRELSKTNLSQGIRTELEAYGKKKFNQILTERWRSSSDLTLVNELKSKIEYAGDVDTLNELNFQIIDNVADGTFARMKVISEDINSLHKLIDEKIFNLYNEQIGTVDEFRKKSPMNLIVVSTELNRLRDLNKKIQKSPLNQTNKDKLDVIINNNVGKIKGLLSDKPASVEGTKDGKGLSSYAHDMLLLKIADLDNISILNQFAVEFEKQMKLDDIESLDDPEISDIRKMINAKRKQLESSKSNKILKTAEEYEIKNLEYEALNKPPELCPVKEIEDVTKYTWGVPETDAMKMYADGKLRQLQSNLDFVAKQKAELEEIVKTKPHVLLTKVQINKQFPASEVDDKIRDMWQYKSKKADYDKNADSARFWQDKVDKIKSGEWQKLNVNHLKQEYIKSVKDAIKHGKPVPYDVIKQYPEFTKSQDSRERYDKGRHTSFANVSIAVDKRHQENHGIKIKLQDGTPMEDKYADDIVKLLSQYQSVIGNITPILKREDVTIAHTKGKHPFLSTAAGCYSPTEITVTLGRKGVGSHELTHFIDETAKRRHKDQPLYDFSLLATAKKNMNGGVERAISLSASKTPEQLEDARELRFMLGTYWKRPEELFARLMEEYTAYKTKGQDALYLHYPYEKYVKTPAYWDDEIFTGMIPQIEAELNRKIELAKD